MEERLEILKSKTVGILSNEEFEHLAEYRHLTKKDGSIVEPNFESFEKDINRLVDNHNKFNMKAFDISYLEKVLDYEAEDTNVMVKETAYECGIQTKYKVLFEKDGRFYRFHYRIDSWGSESIGGLCNDMDSRLNKYICYEVERKEVPIIRIEYHNVSNKQKG